MSASFNSTIWPGTSAMTSTVARWPSPITTVWCRTWQSAALRPPSAPGTRHAPEPDRHGDDPPDDHGIAALTDEVRCGRRRDEKAEQRGTQLVPERRQQPGPVGKRRHSGPTAPACRLRPRSTTGHGCVEPNQDVGRRQCAGRMATWSATGWRGGGRHAAQSVERQAQSQRSLRWWRGPGRPGELSQFVHRMSGHDVLAAWSGGFLRLPVHNPLTWAVHRRRRRPAFMAVSDTVRRRRCP